MVFYDNFSLKSNQKIVGIYAIKFLCRLGARTKLLGVLNWKKLLGSKFSGIYLKVSYVKKIFPQNHPHFQKIQKND